MSEPGDTSGVEQRIRALYEAAERSRREGPWHNWVVKGTDQCLTWPQSAGPGSARPQATATDATGDASTGRALADSASPAGDSGPGPVRLYTLDEARQVVHDHLVARGAPVVGRYALTKASLRHVMQYAARNRLPIAHLASRPRWNCLSFPDGMHYIPGGERCLWCGIPRDQAHAMATWLSEGGEQNEHDNRHPGPPG